MDIRPYHKRDSTISLHWKLSTKPALHFRCEFTKEKKMKDNFKTIALWICGATLMFCFSNNVFSTSNAEAQPAPVMPVSQFDHCVVNVARKVDGPTAKEITAGAAPNFKAVTLRAVTFASGKKQLLESSSWLVDFGNEGWEMIQVTRPNAHTQEFWLKRKK
jgi:hypothetical protein